ncbi:MAG: class I SAM-dependent methyltransferase [Xanthobacteraceae bacterium]|nr:MAG: class I SAM-dependent methyltransferase [Xanthobacteraceae bacterium]
MSPPDFDNKAFWNERYVQDVWLGSGPGSRGIAALFKSHLIEETIRNRQPRSILDVGCGDCCWITPESKLEGIRYLGLDISDVIISNNRSRLPSLEFQLHDLTKDELPARFDLVICLDVLIHQCDSDGFNSALKRLLRAITKSGLISYRTPNSNEHVVPCLSSQDSEITFQSALSARGNSIPHAMTNIFGGLPELIAAIDPAFRVSEIGRYRYQSIYAVQR